MAELNVMPLFTDAWSGDVSDLPNELYGAYTRLIVRWWREGAMPEANEKKLARWAGMSSTAFDDLKEFLEHTEEGWIQRKLMKTYARTLEKSLKAQISANARHKRCERNEELNKRILSAYADRMLSVIRNPEPDVEGTDVPSPQKKKNKKRKGDDADVPRETTDIQLPDDPVLRSFVKALLKHPAIGVPKYRSWFIEDGECCLFKMASDAIGFRSNQAARIDIIEQRFLPILQTIAKDQGVEFYLQRLAA